MYEPDRYRVFSRLGPGNNNPFGALSPEVIQNDIDSIAAELLLQGILKRIAAVTERAGHIGPKGRQCSPGFNVSARCHNLSCAHMFGDLNGQTARRACCSIYKNGLSRRELGAFFERGP